MTAGSAISWAMEMTERGLLTKEDTGGLDFSFGNADVLRAGDQARSARATASAISLALGSRGAARAFGSGRGVRDAGQGPRHVGLRAARIHRHGSQLCDDGPRRAITTRPSRSPPSSSACSGDYDRYSLEGKPALVKSMQDSTAIIDSLIMCMFTVDLGISVELYARCANLPTGMNITADDVYTIGERINTVERLFNIEEGFTRADDMLPSRFAERSRAVRPWWPHPRRRRTSWTSTTRNAAGIATACRPQRFSQSSASDLTERSVRCAQSVW